MSAMAKAARSPAAAGNRMTVRRFSNLVLTVHAAPFEAQPFASALNQIRGAMRAITVALTLRPRSSAGRALQIKVTPAGASSNEDLSTHLLGSMLDPFAGLYNERVTTVEDAIGEENWLATDLYRQFLAPYGARYFLGVDFFTANDVECHFRVIRLEDMGKFTAQDKQLCELIWPHVKNAVHVFTSIDRVRSEGQFFANAVDRMQVGTLILDENNQILKRSEVAAQILEMKDGLQEANGHLEASYRQDNTELQRLLRETQLGATRTETSLVTATTIARPSGKPRYGVLARSITGNHEWAEGKQHATVAVLIRDPERKAQLPPEAMKQLFGFTRMETALAAHMANGLTLEEAAEKLYVSKNTVRAHLRSIFLKTGVTRQNALIHLLMSSTMLLG